MKHGVYIQVLWWITYEAIDGFQTRLTRRCQKLRGDQTHLY